MVDAEGRGDGADFPVVAVVGPPNLGLLVELSLEVLACLSRQWNGSTAVKRRNFSELSTH
jgi:hypothetical protein